MPQKKDKKKKCECKECEIRIQPSDIKGKIEVKDTRKRKDGPGGN